MGLLSLSAILLAMASVPPARHLLRAKDLADARYSEPLTVDDMARAAGLSRAHFSREFRRAFGESPHVYLLTRRLGADSGLRTPRLRAAPTPHVSRGRGGRWLNSVLSDTNHSLQEGIMIK